MNGFETILPFLKPIEHLLLDDSVSEEEKEIARRKFSLSRIKPCVGNEAHRRSAGAFAQCHRAHFARSAAHMQRRRVTCSRKTCVSLHDVDDTVKHCSEHERPGLL